MEKLLIVPSLMEGTPTSSASSSSSTTRGLSLSKPGSSSLSTSPPSPPNYPCTTRMSPTKSPPMTATTRRLNGNKWNGLLSIISTFCILYVLYGKLEFFNLGESTFTMSNDLSGMYLFSFFFYFSTLLIMLKMLNNLRMLIVCSFLFHFVSFFSNS